MDLRPAGTPKQTQFQSSNSYVSYSFYHLCITYLEVLFPCRIAFGFCLDSYAGFFGIADFDRCLYVFSTFAPFTTDAAMVSSLVLRYVATLVLLGFRVTHDF